MSIGNDGGNIVFMLNDWNRHPDTINKTPAEIDGLIKTFYKNLSEEDRKKVCSLNPMGHPYPSLLT